jgi:ABC-2 type transport system ATP-binding protein
VKYLHTGHAVDAIIEVDRIRKSYGPMLALDDVSLKVTRGEVVTLIGPNGAGKTTTIEILEGLRTADSGRVRVLGADPATAGRAIRARIGVQLQGPAGFYNLMTVGEALWLFAAFYPRTVDQRSLLADLGLADKVDVQYRYLSGGLRQRLSLALALLNDPELVFLDEPTTGLDPEARRRTWEFIRRFQQKGRTIVLTTHYLGEADVVSDRVGVMHRGRLLALDVPHRLITASAAEGHIDLFVRDGTARVVPEPLPGVSRITIDDGVVRLYCRAPQRLIADLAHLDAPIAHLLRTTPYRVFTPTLEDAYFALTEGATS